MKTVAHAMVIFISKEAGPEPPKIACAKARAFSALKEDRRYQKDRDQYMYYDYYCICHCFMGPLVARPDFLLKEVTSLGIYY